MKKERKKELELALPSNYSKIEFVRNVYVEEDGRIGAEFSELKLEELDKLDYGYVVVTDEFKIKSIYYYGGGLLKRKQTFFEPEQHYRLNATLYLLQNANLYN